MKRDDWENMSREQLIEVGRLLEQKLEKKTKELTTTRHRLLNARNTVKRQKTIIAYQRKRMLEIYPQAADE
jgi:hypothetical protein